jgi:SNF2 family DNA or RNA helicase
VLLSLGLNNNGSSFFSIDYQSDISTAEMLGEMVNWINYNEHSIQKNKFNIIQKFYNKIYFTKKIEIKTSYVNEKDWFDVYSIVYIGDFQIPFVRFRKHILNNNREYELPNGEIVMLPKEWFTRFADLLYFGHVDGDHILYKQIQLPVLKESFVSLDQNFENSLNKLQESYQQQQLQYLPIINATLRPYQIEGFSWMYRLYNLNMGACLADDMGLGKTIQTLALLQKVIADYTPPVPLNKNFNDTVVSDKIKVPASLIVLPASLVHNWYNEIQKFTPELKVFKYIGTGRAIETDKFNEYDIILTTYGVVRNEYDNLKKYEFLYVILDESQTIKNPDSKIFLAVNELRAKNRLVLTGTPIENSLTDLWSQIEFINPGLLGNISFFKNYFSNPIEKVGDELKREKLKKFIQPFILRRTKEEVATDLPELNEQFLLCSMSESQKNYYEEEKSKVRNEILHSIENVGIEKSSILMINALTKLRQIANHPVMIDKTYSDDSGKLDEIILSLENMFEQGHKVLIFSSFVKHLELIRQVFTERNWTYSILTGKTANREEVVNSFQNCPENKFFLISLKAGGVGLNLTAADYVFILDPWWNPASEMQAINRAHRIGQNKKVFVYRFISAETIEEKIVKLQEKKSELATEFINNNNPIKMLSRENILELLE